MTKTRGDRANLDEGHGALPNVSRRYIRKLVPNKVSVDTRPEYVCNYSGNLLWHFVLMVD